MKPTRNFVFLWLRTAPLTAMLTAALCASLTAQTPATAAAPPANPPADQTTNKPASAPALRNHSNDVGFSYALPEDWQAMDAQPSLPLVRQQAESSAASDDEKRGIACAQVALSARHGSPASMMVVVTLPFDCFGQSISDKDLPGMANGAAEGIKRNFDLATPIYAAYKLGGHYLWIERAKTSRKDNPAQQYTMETVCTALKKGTVCWMMLAADDASLAAFEHGPVTLEGVPFDALVPTHAFDKKMP